MIVFYKKLASYNFSVQYFPLLHNDYSNKNRGKHLFNFLTICFKSHISHSQDGYLVQKKQDEKTSLKA
jgi:hypothetical protein